MQPPYPPRPNNNRLLQIVVGSAIIVFLFIAIVASLIAWRQFAALVAPPAAPTALVAPTLVTPAATMQAATIAATPTSVDDQAGATPAPTATAAPSPTPLVIPTDGPAGSVVAVPVAQPFLIDGDLAAWAAIPSYPSLFRVHTIVDWDGSDDISAFWRLAYDRDNLYVGVVITDDAHVQTQSGNTIFRGDSLEMQIDTDRAGDYGPGLSPDDYQLVLSPGDFSTLPASAFRFRANAAGQSQDAPGHAIQIRARPTEDGYTLEAAIPWIDLGIRPQAGAQLGLALNINDNDTPGSARQEMMKSNVAMRTFADPTTWGILILGE